MRIGSCLCACHGPAWIIGVRHLRRRLDGLELHTISCSGNLSPMKSLPFVLLIVLPIAILAQPSTVNLWPDPAKTASSSDVKETWTERGKNGVVDRGVTFVS